MTGQGNRALNLVSFNLSGFVLSAYYVGWNIWISGKWKGKERISIKYIFMT